eukprot:3239419-Rhodomonas_salina.4
MSGTDLACNPLSSYALPALCPVQTERQHQLPTPPPKPQVNSAMRLRAHYAVSGGTGASVPRSTRGASIPTAPNGTAPAICLSTRAVLLWRCLRTRGGQGAGEEKREGEEQLRDLVAGRLRGGGGEERGLTRYRGPVLASAAAVVLRHVQY